MGGWVYLIALIATIASVDFVVPPVIANLFGLDASNNVVLVAIALVVLALTTAINIVGTRVIAFINNIGVVAEFVGMLVLGSILLFAHRNHPINFLTSTGGTEVNGTYLGTFFAAMLMSLFVVYGFDTAGTLAEETHNPKKAVPRALLLALLGSFVIGGLFLVGAVLAIPADGLGKFMADPSSLESIISDAIPGLSKSSSSSSPPPSPSAASQCRQTPRGCSSRWRVTVRCQAASCSAPFIPRWEHR